MATKVIRKEYKLCYNKDYEYIKPHCIEVKCYTSESKPFWHQCSPNYFTKRGALNWAAKHNITLLNNDISEEHVVSKRTE